MVDVVEEEATVAAREEEEEDPGGDFRFERGCLLFVSVLLSSSLSQRYRGVPFVDVAAVTRIWFTTNAQV